MISNLQSPFLAKEEEQELARRAGAGDDAAVERLITSHVNYVVKIARGYRRSGVPMADLIQEGMVGLVQAVARFNPDRDVRLSTYSMWWIRAAIQDHVVRSWSLVRLSTTSAQKSLFLQLRRMTSEFVESADALTEELSQKLAQKLAERFATTAAEVKNLARRITSRDQSLDAKVSNRGDGAGTWLDRLASDAPSPEDRLVERSERLALGGLIDRALAKLPDREKFIIENRYFAEARQTFAAIGFELNLSKDRVRQLEARALETLRDFLAPLMGDFRSS